MAEAYMKIGWFKEAAMYFNSALQTSPLNQELAKKWKEASKLSKKYGLSEKTKEKWAMKMAFYMENDEIIDKYNL